MELDCYLFVFSSPTPHAPTTPYGRYKAVPVGSGCRAGPKREKRQGQHPPAYRPPAAGYPPHDQEEKRELDTEMVEVAHKKLHLGSCHVLTEGCIYTVIPLLGTLTETPVLS